MNPKFLWAIERAVPGADPHEPGALDMVWVAAPERYGTHAKPLDAMLAFLAHVEPDIIWTADTPDVQRRHWPRVRRLFGVRLTRVRVSEISHPPGKHPGIQRTGRGANVGNADSSPTGKGLEVPEKGRVFRRAPSLEPPPSREGGSRGIPPLPADVAAAALEALRAIDRLVELGAVRMAVAGQDMRGLRPAELDWLEPSELVALQAAQEAFRRLAGAAMTREAARARMEARRAARRSVHALDCDMDEDCTCAPRAPLSPALRRAFEIVRHNGGQPSGLGVSPAVLACRLWPTSWSSPRRSGRARSALIARAAGLLGKLTRTGWLGPAPYGFRALE